MSSMAANPAPPAQQVATANDAFPCTARKKRRDDNWRERRAVMNAQNQTAKAIAARNKAREENIVSKRKVQDVKARVKEVEHELYLDRKANRENKIKLEEQHKLAMNELMETFYIDLEAAYAKTESETAKRLEEEARRINSEQQHRKDLSKERVLSSTKVKKEQARLAKELSGQAAVIDHLHVQWSKKMKSKILKIEKTKDAELQHCLNDNAER